MSETTKVDTSSGTGFLSTAYKGSAELGRFRATLSLIIGIILGILLILSGSYSIMYNEDDLYLEVDGIVQNSSCEPITTYDSKNRPRTSYRCNITVGYTIDNQMYSQPLLVSSGENYVVNQSVSLWVSKADYNRVQLAQMYTSTIGSILLAVAVVLMGLCYLGYYMTQTFEVYASAQGVGTIVDVINKP